ncbi:CPBP family intramembrane glutamic endopeptidase [Opitutus terrae]|uniref:Abortive infection protein n=1 Tax=Opitutus terrae (strain DSM 11246 / JCM 15787 / PB90-1) TaxID=452637 RepID=B1ZT03_OPITP|nr:CPBP family intramembrane glutamic endopeptidase [Opitutus terrae]ACB75792.1 Abortive infection protein [Opitutus terrae PB90-1]
MPVTPFTIAVVAAELSLLLAGVILLWRVVLRPAARVEPRIAGVPRWDISLLDFLLFVFLVFAAGMVGNLVAGLAFNGLAVTTDAKTVVSSAGFQLGLLGGVALLPAGRDQSLISSVFDRRSLLSGVGAFLIALPIITLVNIAWLWLLQALGVPADQQDLLRLFSATDSVALLGVMIVLATLVAPLAEELLFRAAIFRYLRTRIPRWLALLLPGLVFAALHVNWSTHDGLASFAPLVTLAVVFSLAYEHTGRIGTAVVAHALFNLHTILILLSGVLDEAPTSF